MKKRNILRNLKSSSPEPLCQFNQTWHKASMDGGNSTLNKKGPFNSQKGDNAFFCFD